MSTSDGNGPAGQHEPITQPLSVVPPPGAVPPTTVSWPPSSGQPYGPPAPFATLEQQTPPSRRRRGVLLTALAVVVTLVAGVGVWLFATRSASTAEPGSPQAAAELMLSSLSGRDPIAAAEGLDPYEAQPFVDIAADLSAELTRLGFPDQGDFTGISLDFADLRLSDQVTAITPTVSVVEVTDGRMMVTVPVEAGAFWQEGMIESVDYDHDTGTFTVDLGALSRESGQPLRVATVNRDGTWYVSAFHTIADNVAWSTDADYRRDPATALGDGIPAVGAADAEAAVDEFLLASLDGDLTRMIELADPHELEVLHTYGRLLTRDSELSPSGVTVLDTTWTVSELTGGTLVGLSHLELEYDGGSWTVDIDHDAGRLTVTGDEGGIGFGLDIVPTDDGFDVEIDDGYSSQLIEGDDLMREIAAMADIPVTDELIQLFQRLYTGMLGTGVVVTEVDGSWYLSPIRTAGAFPITLYSDLDSGDAELLTELEKLFE